MRVCVFVVMCVCFLVCLLCVFVCVVCVRGLYIATGQYSSFCGCALGLVLGDLDNMGVEVQDREQVGVREKVEARETEEEDKTKKQQTLRHVMTCGRTCFMQTRRATP